MVGIERLGYVSAHLIRKTLEAYTQDYPGVRHKCEVMRNNSTVVRLPSLPDSMCSVSRNKEDSSVDLLEDIHSRKHFWGLVFYGVRTKLVAYYRLWSKDPTSSSTLDALGKLIAEHSIPRMMIMDNDSILGVVKKWKKGLGQTLTPSTYMNHTNTVKTWWNVPIRI